MDFLRLPESKWPQDSPVADEVEVKKEHHNVHIVGEQIKTQPLVFKLETAHQSYSLYVEIYLETANTWAQRISEGRRSPEA